MALNIMYMMKMISMYKMDFFFKEGSYVIRLSKTSL